MKAILTALLLFSQLQAFAVDNILAIVNGKVITSNSIKQALETTNSFDEKIAIINQQIDNYLVQEKIKERGITPSAQLLDDAVKTMAKDNSVTLEELTSHPQFPSILELINFQLSISQIKHNIAQRVSIDSSDKELDSCQQQTTVNNTKQIRIAQIIISNVEGADNHEIAAKELLNKIAKHVTKGASFFDFAKLHSQDPSYAQGGLSNWLTLKDSNLDFFGSLKKGEVSKIYQANSGWAIAIKVDERHINLNLEACKKHITDKRINKFYRDWIQELRDSAYIEIFSDNL